MNDCDFENVSEALLSIASALRHLGTADAATPMGALELLSLEVKEGSQRIENGLMAIANAIRERA